MISIYKTETIKRKPNNTSFVRVELRGLSTDSKPTSVGEKVVDNGSVFIEIDTGKMYLYDLDNEQWKEV